MLSEGLLVRGCRPQTSVAAAVTAARFPDPPGVPVEIKTTARCTSPVLFSLLLLNLVLQLFDGVATYAGLHLGIQEGNPLLRDAFAFWGLGTGLLLIKGHACGLLLMLYRLASESLAVTALGMLAAVYSVCSLVPWLGTFALIIFKLS